MYLPDHLPNQWYILCFQDKGDAPIDINNRQLIQVDNASFYRPVSTVSYQPRIS